MFPVKPCKLKVESSKNVEFNFIKGEVETSLSDDIEITNIYLANEPISYKQFQYILKMYREGIEDWCWEYLRKGKDYHD